MTPVFRDRSQAGRRLGDSLAERTWVDPVVLALPRGGVPVAAEVAARLGAPLDLLLVRKIGAPHQPEVAVAAIVDGTPPEIVVDDDLLSATGTARAWVEARARQEWLEIERQRALYLGARTPVPLQGRTAIVIDDGLATGTSARAALRALRSRSPRRLVLAVPVAPRETLDALRDEVDDMICLAAPEPFVAVGAHYEDFAQVEDDVVVALMRSKVGGLTTRHGRH